jgi:predicted nucleic acid-binding protein
MLIDTSGFFCLHDKAEQHHNRANEINKKTATKITTNYVLAEYCRAGISPRAFTKSDHSF